MEEKRVTFGSRHPGLMVVLEPGGPKMVDGVWVPKVPFKGVTFAGGTFSTTDPQVVKELKNHSGFGSDFWILSKPEDAERVNPGRTIEVAGGAKGTHSTPRK